MIAAVTFICVRMLITASSNFSQASYRKIILGSGRLLGEHYWLQVLDQHVSRMGAYSPWDSSMRQAGAKCFEYINLMELIFTARCCNVLHINLQGYGKTSFTRAVKKDASYIIQSPRVLYIAERV